MRTFVQTGNRIEGRAEILKGLKPGDRVVAVGQLKLQSGAAVVDLDRSAAADSGEAAALLGRRYQTRARLRVSRAGEERTGSRTLSNACLPG